MTEVKRRKLPMIGWREWVALPDFGVARIKAKVDTGARTSALHAFEIEEFTREGRPMVRFVLHPEQDTASPAIEAEAPVLDERLIRSSFGRVQHRIVILTRVQLGEALVPIELTLARRDMMGFRMLLGRTALRRRFVVNPGRSYLLGP